MFDTLDTSLQTCKQYLNILDNDTLHDSFLINLLEKSSGVDKTTLDIEYRPFYVCAIFRKMFPDNNGVIEMIGTDTVKFQNPETVIQGFEMMQKELDLDLINIKKDFQTKTHTFSALVV